MTLVDYQFQFSISESEVVSGDWSYNNAQLILTAEDGSAYVFDSIDSCTLGFDAASSSPLPLEDGAEFVLGVPGFREIHVIQETTYQMDQVKNGFSPLVILRMDGSFVLAASMLSSQYITGTWTEQDGEIVLNRDSGDVYRFQRLGENIIRFVAEGSSEIWQSGEFAPLVEDGAIFTVVTPAPYLPKIVLGVAQIEG